MSRIVCRCPECGSVIDRPLSSDTRTLDCQACRAVVRTSAPPPPSGRIERCLVCPCRELFIRKNFPPRLGVLIVVIGFAVSCLTYYHHWILATYAVLLGTALVDVVLYTFMGNVLECYACHAQYHGSADVEQHAGFDLEIHERHRQQRARLSTSRSSSPGS
jgi:hypothetical protein